VDGKHLNPQSGRVITLGHNGIVTQVRRIWNWQITRRSEEGRVATGSEENSQEKALVPRLQGNPGGQVAKRN